MGQSGQQLLLRLWQRNAARDATHLATGALRVDARRPLWMRATAWVMAAVTYLSPIAFLYDEVAQAAPIVDPHAPITFQPTVTQSSAGTPVVNVPAPNTNGLSVSQFQSLSVGSEGLIFNNSLVAGTSLTGGQVGANANLVAAGRTASTILAEVTATGSQYASVISGPVEIFGNTAALIIANPNGISVPGGTALTNISNLTLTTGTPQFITGTGGTATDYANAGALAYSVSSGNISISGPPGNNGTPGAGIAGTVGNLDLIAQSVNLNAPLNADQRVNIITGNQLVTPTSSDATGITYSQSSNGTANTAAATGLPAGSYAINANQFGSVTAGTILLVGTSAGLGVNMQGPLMATVGNVQVNANGDVTVANTYASQNVSIASTGSTSLSGTGLANENYTVNASGDINATGTVSAGQNAALTAGGNLNAASVSANGNTTLNAGNSMTVGSVSGQNLALTATSGSLTLNSAVTAPGTIAASAGQDLAVNGAVQGGSTVGLTAGQNATVNGSVSGVGNVSLTAQSGSAQVTGDVVTNAALTVLAGQGVVLGENAGNTISAQGPVSVTATAGDATLSGTTVTPGALTVTAGGNATLGGQTQAYSANVSAGSSVAVSGTLSTIDDATLAATGGNLTGTGAIGTTQGNVSLTAGQSISYSGAVQGGAAVTAIAGLDATLADVSAIGAIAIRAGQDATETGNLTGGSTVSITGARNATVSGSVNSVGNASLTAQTGTVQADGNLQSNGSLTVSSGQGTTLGGTAQAQGAVSVSSTAGSITGQGSIASSQGAVSLDANQNIQLSGPLQSATTLTATAGGDASLGGTVTAPGAIAITSGGNTTIGGNATSGSTLSVLAGGNASVQGSAASVGDMSLAATSGMLDTTGSVTTLGAFTASGQQGVTLGGAVSSQGNAQIASGAGTVVVDSALTTPGTVTINAGQDATVAGSLHSGQATTVSAGQNIALNGGLEVDGTGNATVTAGGNLTGSGAMNVANNTSLSAGGNIGLTGAIQTGNNLGATAGTNLSVGATTAVGTETLTATNGSATLAGNALSGGDMTVVAGTNVGAQGLQTLGNLNVNAQGGNLSTTGAVQAAGSATLNAGQTMTLGGQTTISGNTTLTGANIATQGLAVGGNLSASATGNLDTSAGQLNAAFNASAPALSVNGNATLSGANVTTANAVVGGTYSATGTTSLTTGGTAAYEGNATLNGGTVTNVGTQMAAGNLSVSGSTVTNQGELSSLQTMAVTAANLNNSGSIYGPTNTLNVSGTTTNSGGLLATNTLTLTSNSLNNSNGLIFAGDTSNPTAATGTATVTVTGGNGSFNNAAGQILAQNIATLNLPNQTIDPSSAAYGTVNGGYGLNLSVQGISNSGTWTLPGTTVNVTATNGISNSGTISQGTGTLALNGAATNSGTVSTSDLTINGSLANQAGATVQANDALTIAGSGASTNAGTVEAVNTLNITGASYDNSNGFTQAGNSSSAAGAGNVNINLTGALTNVNGSLTATNDMSVTAGSVINDAPAAQLTTTTTTVSNPALVLDTVIGTSTEQLFWVNNAQDSGATYVYEPYVASLTVADLLSPAGDTTLASSIPTTGSVTFVLEPVSQPVTTQNYYTGTETPGYQWVLETASTPTSNPATGQAYQTETLALPTVSETTATVQPVAGQSVIAAGQNLSMTANSLSNVGGSVSAGGNVTLNLGTLSNGAQVFSSSVTDQVDPAGLSAFLSALDALNTPTSTGGAPVVGLGVQALSTRLDVDGAGGVTLMSSPQAPGNGIPGTQFAIDAPGTATPESTSSSVQIVGPAGSITAGNNLSLSGGNLTNAGTLAAGNDVSITASSFTNQGVNSGTTTVTQGCTAGSGSAGCTQSEPILTVAGARAIIDASASYVSPTGTGGETELPTPVYQSVECANGNMTGCGGVASTTSNPDTTSYSYQTTPASVIAGNDIVIAASSVSNTYGNLVAGRNVVIGGAGTSASDTSTTPTSLTQASSVTNTSGSIEAGNDVDINATTLTNTIAAPVQIHQNYGSAAPFTDCGSSCEAYIDVQSAAPATITANGNVNLTAGTFGNTGSLVTALNNVTINAASSASSSDQYLYAYYHGQFTGTSVSASIWGCAGVQSLCATLYGSAYQPGGTQNPAGLPDAVGLPDFVAGTIQAGNTLAVNSPTLTNTGNVIGQSVNLSGATLVNGLTNPNVYTPPPAISGQVISLGPPSVPSGETTTVNSAGLVTTLGGQPISVTGAAGLPSNTPIGVQTVGKPVAPTVSLTGQPSGAAAGTATAGTAATPGTTSVQTIAGKTYSLTYLVNSPASQLTSELTPAALLAALPASLQPSTTQFYYDPYTQAQQVEQAALEATGNSSFYSTTSATDSTSQASINNQDTQALYGAALQYAEQNNVALGTQLSAAQLALVNEPMLWYTEETVPEPGCTATGNGACPTVQALMPEVLLPQNYAEVNADGTISGTNVSLNYSDSILNTGSVSASGTLTVNTGTLTNEERSTNVGTIYDQLNGGVLETTGTVVQQGGFMSAANYDLNADAIDQIGGALQVTNADGSVNTAATTQLLSNLKSQLGSSFTQGAVSNDLNTTFIANDPGGWLEEVSELAFVAVISVMTAGAGAAAVGATAGTIEAGVANAAVSSLASTLATDAVNGNFSLSGLVESVGVAMLTAGVTSGITLNSSTDSLGLGNWNTPLGSGVNTLGQLAGVAPAVGSSTVATASATLATLPTQALAIAGESVIQAGAQTAIEGGSFLNALKDDAVSDVAAAGAYDIGTAFNGQLGSLGTTSDPAYVLAHAALGCAASAAEGTGCAGGAIGGAESAALTPLTLDAMDPTHDPLTTEQTAVVTAVAMLAGGGAAAALGQNPNAAATAAENEALNNATGHWFIDKVVVPLVCLYCQMMGQETLPEVEPMPTSPPTEIVQKPPTKTD